jgi:type II secretion system protein G
MKNQRGFTLVELLVVIAIIGILAAVVIVSVNSARKKGNDAKVKADLNAVMTGIELYANANNAFPKGGTCGQNGIVAAAGGTICNAALKDANTTYIEKMPTHPVSGKSYTWTAVNNYTISGELSDGSTFTCVNGSCN